MPAATAAVDAEVAAVRAVGSAACPLAVALERVIVTSTGTVSHCLAMQLSSSNAMSLYRSKYIRTCQNSWMWQTIWSKHPILHANTDQATEMNSNMLAGSQSRGLHCCLPGAGVLAAAGGC